MGFYPRSQFCVTEYEDICRRVKSFYLSKQDDDIALKNDILLTCMDSSVESTGNVYYVWMEVRLSKVISLFNVPVTHMCVG